MDSEIQTIRNKIFDSPSKNNARNKKEKKKRKAIAKLFALHANTIRY